MLLCINDGADINTPDKLLATLEKKAASERQPRRKWEYVQEITKLKGELQNG